MAISAVGARIYPIHHQEGIPLPIAEALENTGLLFGSYKLFKTLQDDFQAHFKSFTYAEEFLGLIEHLQMEILEDAKDRPFEELRCHKSYTLKKLEKIESKWILHYQAHRLLGLPEDKQICFAAHSFLPAFSFSFPISDQSTDLTEWENPFFRTMELNISQREKIESLRERRTLIIERNAKLFKAFLEQFNRVEGNCSPITFNRDFKVLQDQQGYPLSLLCYREVRNDIEKKWIVDWQRELPIYGPHAGFYPLVQRGKFLFAKQVIKP